MQIFLRKYFNRQVRSIRANFHLPAGSDELEVIHRIRLSMKRINAFSVFLEFVSPAEYPVKAPLKAMNRVFLAFGTVRDIGVHRITLENLTSGHDLQAGRYFRYLDGLEIRAWKKLGSRLKKYDLSGLDEMNELVAGMLATRTGQSLRNSYGRFVAIRLKAISQFLLRPSSREEDLHFFRRELKEYLYLEEMRPPGFTKPSAGDLQALRRLEKLLGSWHDTVSDSTFMKQFLEQNPDLPKKKPGYESLSQLVETRHQQAAGAIMHEMAILSKAGMEARMAGL
jgi:CHAD domain-containing protein